MRFHYDCRFFRGDKPCKYGTLCSACNNYHPWAKRILIIKLAAMGDALRTTTILPALKKIYPDCQVTWITDKSSYELLRFSSLIDRLFILDLNTALRIDIERFDLLLSFDKAGEAISLASKCKARVKKGFSMTSEGQVAIFNKGSKYALMLGLSDELKFRRNKKTYQRIIFEMVGLNYNQEEYVLDVPKNERFLESFFKMHNLNKQDVLVGVFPGCGSIFPTKKWSIEGYVHLIDDLAREKYLKVVLLGGPEERERNRKIKSMITSGITDAGCENSLEDFIRIISLMDIVIAADTLALHLAIACKKRTVGLFTSTCDSEIELYGRGEIIKADMECSPCYKKDCESMKCLEAIKKEQIIEAVKRQAVCVSK